MGRGVLRLCAWFLEIVFIDAAEQTFTAVVPNGLAQYRFLNNCMQFSYG